MGNPTIATRFSITPSPTAEPVLIALAKLTGKPKAAIVRDLIDAAIPALRVTLEAVAVAKTNPERMIALLNEMAAKSIHDLTGAQMDLAIKVAKKPGRKPKVRDR